MEVLTQYSATITLAKAIEKTAAEAGTDSYLVGMARRAKVVEEEVERGQTDTAKALERLFAEVEILCERRWNQRNTESTIDRPKAGGKR